MDLAQLTKEDNKNCHLCEKVIAKYVCPRCGVSYCSLGCYRSGPHLSCSESFYRDCVTAELKLDKGQATAQQSANDMNTTLQRFHQQQLDQEEEGEEELDSDDETPLAERLAGIDLEDAENVWSQLTKEERAEFKSFVSSVKVEELVEQWTPWWMKEPSPTKLVQEVENNTDSVEQDQPLILDNIPSMSSLTRVKPNEMVNRGLANVIASYVWSCRLYNGDFASHHNPLEVVTSLITLSSFLSKDAIFTGFEHALVDVSLNACQIPELFDGGPALQSTLAKDVFCIMGGGPPSSNDTKLYVLSALSDCYRLLERAIQMTKKQQKEEHSVKEDSFQKMFPSSSSNSSSSTSTIVLETKLLRKTLRKLYYLLAFANEHPILPPLL